MNVDRRVVEYNLITWQKKMKISERENENNWEKTNPSPWEEIIEAAEHFG